MPRNAFNDDDDNDDYNEFEEVADAEDSAVVDDLDEDVGDQFSPELDDDDDDDEDEEELGINRETEDWSESIDDMESDYWEDYTRQNH